MEDFEDNISIDGKRFYMSHSEYFYSDEEKNKITLTDMDFSKPMQITQLVCASNIENARKAVVNAIEKEGRFVVTKCRIDFLIIGD